jgi:hypothetical protein
LIGTPGHSATVKWIRDTILKYPDYYTVSLQPFDLSVGISANLTVNDVALEVFPVGLSPQGTVSGELAHIPFSGCDPADFPTDLTGRIVLVLRGICQSGVKVALAGARGAVGAIVYNIREGNLDGHSLQRVSNPEGPYVPTGGISHTDGRALRDRIAAGEVITANFATKMSETTT